MGLKACRKLITMKPQLLVCQTYSFKIIIINKKCVNEVGLHKILNGYKPTDLDPSGLLPNDLSFLKYLYIQITY